MSCWQLWRPERCSYNVIHRSRSDRDDAHVHPRPKERGMRLPEHAPAASSARSSKAYSSPKAPELLAH